MMSQMDRFAVSDAVWAPLNQPTNSERKGAGPTHDTLACSVLDPRVQREDLPAKSAPNAEQSVVYRCIH